jgi:hypothetical protein
VTRHRARFYDPDGARYGIPTYPWRWAPEGLATRRQLAALGLRPAGQDIAAQVMWRQWRRDAVAYLYRIDLAAPKRVASPAVLAACQRALAARRTCPDCHLDVGYVLPQHLGVCLDCAERKGLRIA